MKKIFVFLLFTGSLVSCRKTGSTPNMISGTYSGTFVRWVGKNGLEARVNLIFSGDTFNGASDSTYYPAICNGTYKITNNPDSISFVNQCVFTANFDGTLILQGPYKLIQSGDSLYIRRTIGDFIYEEDVYSLRKQ